MIEYVKGNVLNAPEGTAIVHGCNSQGVMGSGVALEVKKRYPEAFEVYLREFYTLGLKLGTITQYVTPEKTLIVNGITQGGYGRSGKRFVNYEAVANVFETLVRDLKFENEHHDMYPGAGFSNIPVNIHTIAFPKIGAGLGGGSWDVISAIIDEAVPDTFRKICYEL